MIWASPSKRVDAKVRTPPLVDMFEIASGSSLCGLLRPSAGPLRLQLVG